MSGRAAANFIVENAKPGSAMLEMGCGKGVVTEILAERFPGLEVVEGAEANVRMVRNLLGDRVVIHHELFERFEPERQYDDIVMGRMLGHVDDARFVLTKAASWLVPGGRIHIVVPNAGSVHRRIGVAMGMLETIWSQSHNDIAVGQRRVFDAGSLKVLIKLCGLRLTALRGTLLKPFSSAQMESYTQKLLDAFYEIGQQLSPEFTAEIYVCCEIAA
ncbi:MAG: hypothetical protein AMJ84_03720 [Acidithiobacillales bacterium SM23_46]|nr:MAG: hypothetical protein AMJ84_03720 [Acidithiobacillales bacterium SM23_46]